MGDTSIYHNSRNGASVDWRPSTVPAQNRSEDATRDSKRNDVASLHDRAASLTGKLLRLLGIRRVVDVDDSWRDDAEPDKEFVLAVVGGGLLSLSDLQAKDATRELVVDSDGSLLDMADVADNIRRDWDDFPVTVQRELTDAAKVVERDSDASRDGMTTEASLPHDPSKEEGTGHSEGSATSTDASTLLLLRDMVEPEAQFVPLTLKSWHHRQEELLGDSTPTLVLFDQDFSREGGSKEEGEKLLVPLLKRGDISHVAFGLLTHRVSALADETQLASEISARHNAEEGRVIVIAKSRIREDPNSLASALRIAMVARELKALRDQAVAALDEAHTSALASLKSLDSWTSMAMLAAARGEGVHEPEGLIRIARNDHRRRLAAELRVDSVTTGPLPKLRQALDIDLRPWGMSRPSNLWPLQRSERYDDYEHLSSLHLALETGDIFQVVDPKTGVARGRKHCILLVQPCDAAVRPDGKRAYDPKVLAVAWMKQARDGDDSRKNVVLLQSFDPTDGSDWVVQLSSRTYLPVRALDASVLSADGLAKVEVGQPMPANLTPPWQKKFKELQDWAAAVTAKLSELKSKHPELAQEVWNHLVSSLTCATSEVHGIGAYVDIEKGVASFGLRRVSRLTDPDARALLTLASQHQARPALDGPLLLDIDAPS